MMIKDKLKTERSNVQNALIIGHRGAAAFAPENTLAAFEKARALHCQWIEFDVMLSQDGKPFIVHDETLSRTTNGQGEVGNVDSSYLQSLDAGGWFSSCYRGEKIPTLYDAIQWLNRYELQANIEIKPYKDRVLQTTMVVLDEIKKYWACDKAWPLISSFDYRALELCHLHAPELPRGLLMHRWQKNWLALARGIDCFSVHLNQHIVSSDRVRAIKNAGYGVFVYTVNSKRRALNLLNLGVDGIFSDNPGLL